jgi:polyhydroxyalkanoate synthesis regulator protein
MFQNAMRMFTPFPAGAASKQGDGEPQKEAGERDGDLQDLKEQIAAMQRKLDTLS